MPAASVLCAVSAAYCARMGDDLDPRDTAEVRRRVVVPVATSLLRPDEFEDVRIDVGLDPFPSAEREEMLRVAVKACGEWIEAPRWWVTGAPMDARSLAAELYDSLQDEIAESRFAWGELRQGTFEVPPPERP